MKHTLTIIFILTCLYGKGQIVVQTKAQWTASMDSIKNLAITASLKALSDSFKTLLPIDGKTIISSGGKAVSVTDSKPAFDSTNKVNVYQNKRQDSLVSALKTANSFTAYTYAYNNIQTINTNITGLTNRTVTLEANYATLNNRLVTVENTTASLNTRVGITETAIISINSSIALINTELKTIPKGVQLTY